MGYLCRMNLWQLGNCHREEDGIFLKIIHLYHGKGRVEG